MGVDEQMSILGQIIKDARQAAELTQDELAKLTGITTRYIMAIENENKQPSMKVLFKLIRSLKISADTVFYPENQHTDKKKEYLIHMIQLCDERETKVATATIRALLDTK
jgi:DNA-binding XRE family transcriptional regulator